MANIGEQLSQPEQGMQRIDNNNINIKYIGDGFVYLNDIRYYNTTRTTLVKSTDKIKFYIYSSSISIIAPIGNDLSENVFINIDGTEYNFSCYNADLSSDAPIFQALTFKKTGLNKSVHEVTIYLRNSTFGFVLDAIDIDEDGYMIYHDDVTDKSYYDITPTMTSNTTPSPYKVSASSVFTSKYDAFHAFDGMSYGDDTSFAPSTNNGWLCLDFGNKVKSNAFIIGTGSEGFFGKDSYPKTIELLTSNSDTGFSEVKSYTNITDWNLLENKKFVFNTQNSRSYRINVPLIVGNNPYLNIAELRYLLDVDTSFYLIKDNNDNKIYNYDEDSNALVEVEDTSILNKNALENTCIYNLEKVFPLLDTLSDNLTILCNNNNKVIANGIKNNNTLIIAKSSFSTRIAKNIDFFELVSNIEDTSSIKMAVSVDEGITWKVWNNTAFEDLTNTCPLKEYSTLDEEEIVQWDTFKEEVYTKGMDGKTINTIDFNSIKEDNMMFAYVLNRDLYENSCEMSNLQYQFDAYGSYTLLKDSEVDIKQNVSSINVTPKKDVELMKINMGSSGEVNIYNGSTDNIEEATEKDIENILGGEW